MPPGGGKHKAALPRFYRPDADLDPQVMVTSRHSLTDTLRFAEVVYAHVKARSAAHIDWSLVSADVGLEPAECMRLWRYVAYHWKGPLGHKQSNVEFEQVDLAANSDPEGAVTHAVAVSVRKFKKKGAPGAPGEKRSCLPVGALGFTVFGRANRQRVKDANPGIAFGDIAKELGRQWRAMPECEKTAWIERAVAEKSPRKAGKSSATKVKHADRKRERDLGPLPPLPPQRTRAPGAAGALGAGASAVDEGAGAPCAAAGASDAPPPPQTSAIAAARAAAVGDDGRDAAESTAAEPTTVGLCPSGAESDSDAAPCGLSLDADDLVF
ncbi:hypothetical protein KFE25_007952 [Diacronema lutheri]|uniref:HMG box domain-containing protein n=1 Tax=Diacronema lutheri TaxID=2081491 RepID=A0A8J5XKR9_DIALT|nr:hypothetical protein KFE25_007952 [Diacronema lutheri]